MRVILKVVRCNINGFRLGLFLPDNVDVCNVNYLKVCGLSEEPIIISSLNAYRRYGSIIHPAVSHFIVDNGLSHEAGNYLHLLRFELTCMDDGSHILQFVGACPYQKRAHQKVVIGQNGDMETLEVNDVIDRVFFD